MNPFVLALALWTAGEAPDPAAVGRGRKALLERSHIEGKWALDGFRKLEKDKGGSIQERYGLFHPPYENGGLPMGLRRRNDDRFIDGRRDVNEFLFLLLLLRRTKA